MSLGGFVLSQLKHARRYNKVIRVLLKHGFDDYVSRLSRSKRFSFFKLFFSRKRLLRAQRRSRWERMRMACEDLGPTFIKLGQILSTRRDLIPEPLIQELTKLQDDVAPFSSKIARKIVEEELNAKIEDIFDEFEETPFASASMAQVHRARLKTGEEVVLKIQRPEIRKVIDDDLKIMRDVARELSIRMPSIRHFDPVGLVEQFAESIHFEMDFLHEAVNLRRFAYHFEKDPIIMAPKVYIEQSTPKLLTMQFIDGIKPMSTNALRKAGVEQSWLAREVIHSFFKQVFDYGFFHADPHAGNIIVTHDKKIYFIDFGMMGTILRKDMQSLGMLILSVEQQDVQNIMRALTELSETPYFENKKRLEYDLVEFVNKFAFTDDFHLLMSEMLVELSEIIRAHNLHVPSHFFLLMRASFAVEGLVRTLDPDIVLMDQVRPIIDKKIMQELNPISTGRKLLTSLYDLAAYMEDFPSDLRQTMRLIRSGKMIVDIEHRGMEPFVHTLEKVSHQMMATILVSAMLLASIIFVFTDVGPKWNNFSLYAMIGFALSTLVGSLLMLRVRKAQKEFEARKELHS